MTLCRPDYHSCGMAPTTISAVSSFGTRPDASAAQPHACFHCGLPLRSAVFPVAIEGITQETCCAGCQAIARTIADNGLASYYRTRTEPPPPAQTPADLLDELKLFDLPEIQRSFVRTREEDDICEASLLLEGITCAACVWLIEHRVARIPGVQSISINYAARRARVAWDVERARLSEILRAVRELGYGVQPFDSTRSDDALRAERRSMLWRLFVSGFGMMQVMMYAFPAYMAGDGMDADLEQLMRLASLVLTAPVALWAAMPFYAGAWRELRSGRVGMDVPVAAGIIVAFVASVAATWRGSGEVYFDSIAMFVFLLLAARFLEMNARIKAADAQQRLGRLVPATAERLDRYPEPLARERVPAATLRPGDLVEIRAGAAIPADGSVIDGVSAADEALLTGESRPVPKQPGDRVTGGSLNLQSPLVVRVEHVGEQSVLGAIVRLMDRAQAEKPAVALAAERAARWFVTLVLALTALSAIWWYTVDPSRVLWVAISILVVTCPCALSLATPAVVTAATGALYRSGVLVTRGRALETLARATHVVFDKTGTLTLGRMSLIGVLPLGLLTREQCLEYAAALEAGSEHPLGRGIAAAAPAASMHATQRRNVPGHGIEAGVNGNCVRIGTPAFVAKLHGRALPDELAFISDDVTVVALGDAHGWLALLTLSDGLRPDARRVVAQLKSEGKTVCLLSGDGRQRVEQVAAELGIQMVKADATPEMKLAFVADLQRQGAVVAMVGDGVNDAPVMAQAQVSIAMAAGTELAHNSADMILMSERLQPLVEAFRIANRALRVIRQNLAWATVYNAVALPLAVAGEVTPLVAAIGMSVSSLVVVLNALRLLPSRASGERESRASPLWKQATGTA